MKMTIKEIAEMAGVHRATVDKVLHKRVGVSDEVRQKVQAIIDQVGYTPNPAGRVLQKQGRTYHIAVILIDVDALPFLEEGIAKGVSDQVGFDIQIAYHVATFQDAQRQEQLLLQAIDDRADGVIISPINSGRVRAAIDRAVDAGIPVVTTNCDIDGSKRLCYVGLDGLRASRVAGRLMGQFLGRDGRLAIISSSMEEENNNYDVAIREQGFVEFVKKNYPKVDIVAQIESFENPAITYQKTLEVLRSNPDLSGLYITCGGALEVGRALRECGREKDVVVLSFEDYPAILELLRDDVIDCTLSSDLQRQGALPVEILMDYLVFGKKPESERVFTEMKVLVKESLY